MAAMQGILASNCVHVGEDAIGDIARASSALADTMLKERNQ